MFEDGYLNEQFRQFYLAIKGFDFLGASVSQKGGVLVAVLVATMLVLFFLFGSSGKLRIMSIRLYSSMMSACFIYLGLVLFPDISVAIFSLIGSVDQEALDAFLILNAAIVFFTFWGYFIFVIVDGTQQSSIQSSNTAPRSGTNGDSNKKSSQNSDFGDFVANVFGFLVLVPTYFLPMLVTRVAFVLRYGLLPLVLVVVVMQDSWTDLGPLLERMLYSLVGRLDAIFSSDSVSSVIQYLKDAFWEVLESIQGDKA